MNAPDRHLTADPNTAMESKLRQRLTELRTEYHKGQQTLRDLEGQAANVRATLLRIPVAPIGQCRCRRTSHAFR